MTNIKIKLKYKLDNSHHIVVEPNLINHLAPILKKHNFGLKYCVITDAHIKKIHGEALAKLLNKADIEYFLLTIPVGEIQKNMDTIINLSEKLSDLGITRKDCLIAFGGGVIGDLTGFLSSIYMRGLPYINIPTSFLAMVDSSIGGKTALNGKKSKNLLGTFNHPQAVFIDSLFLETLPESEIRSGLAEIIKYAVSLDKNLFSYLEKNVEKIFQPEKNSPWKYNHHILNKLITASCRIKASIVELDEKENFLRLVLNYGHTFGHAIEKASQYKIPHGYAIAIGMNLANEKAVEESLLKEKHAARIKQLLQKTKLPCELPKNIKKSDLFNIMKRDKKNLSQNQIRYVLIRKIGKACISI